MVKTAVLALGRPMTSQSAPFRSKRNAVLGCAANVKVRRATFILRALFFSPFFLLMQADLTPLDILDQKTALQAYVSAPMHDQRVYCSCVLVAGPLATFAHELPLMSDHGCVHTRGRLEREHRTALVALDEISQQSVQRPVYQKRGNILFRSDAKKVNLQNEKEIITL